MYKEDLNRDKKIIEVLYKEYLENGLEELGENQEYIDACKACKEALAVLEKDMPSEKLEQLNNFDDKAIAVLSLIQRAYYAQGYMDARG